MDYSTKERKDVKFASALLDRSSDLFPIIPIAKSSEFLPRLHDILDRKENDIGIDEIDQLQHEVEELLSKCVQRETILTKELELLSRKPREFKKQLSDLVKLSVEKEFRKSSTSLPSSSTLQSLSTPLKLQTSPALKIKPNVSNTSRINDHLNSSTSTSTSTACKTVAEGPVINNELLLKFWQFVDGYCGSFNDEHINHLAELNSQLKSRMNEQTSSSEIDQFIQNRKMEAESEPVETNTQSSKCDQKVSENSTEENESANSKNETDSLIDLLFSCGDVKLDGLPLDKYQELIKSRKNINENKTHLNVDNALCLEVNLRQKLLEKGILKPTDLPEDELLNDLQQTEAEIEKTERFLFDKTTRMFSVVKNELLFDRVKSSRSKLDTEIVDLYMKYFYAKPNESEDSIIEKRIIEKRVLEILQEYKGLKKTSNDLKSSILKKPKL